MACDRIELLELDCEIRIVAWGAAPSQTGCSLNCHHFRPGVSDILHSNFANRFANNKEQGIAIYVPIGTLADLGARLATNGVICAWRRSASFLCSSLNTSV